MQVTNKECFEQDISNLAQHENNQKVELKSSYKLRAYYSLLLMKSQEIHNALYDFVSAFSTVGIDIHRSPELEILDNYSPDSQTSLELVNAVFEIICQAHDEMYDRGYETYQVFRSYPSIRNLIINPNGSEEYRPSEEIPFSQVIDMASDALSSGDYEEAKSVVSDLINFPIELELDLISMEIAGQKLPAEVNYVKINRELAELNEYMTDKDDMLLEMSDEEIQKHFRGPIDNLRRSSQEALVSKNVWEKIKSSCSNAVSSAVENITRSKPEVVAESNFTHFEPEEPQFNVPLTEDINALAETHIEPSESFVLKDEYLVSPILQQATPKFLFDDIKTVERTELDGYYGYVRLFGLITIQKNIFVKNRNDIKPTENKINKFIKWACRVDWLTKNGNPVAYF